MPLFIHPLIWFLYLHLFTCKLEYLQFPSVEKILLSCQLIIKFYISNFAFERILVYCHYCSQLPYCVSVTKMEELVRENVRYIFKYGDCCLSMDHFFKTILCSEILHFRKKICQVAFMERQTHLHCFIFCYFCLVWMGHTLSCISYRCKSEKMSKSKVR